MFCFFVIFLLLIRCLITPLFIFDLLHAAQHSPELPFLGTLDVVSDYTHKDQLSISKPSESGTHTHTHTQNPSLNTTCKYKWYFNYMWVTDSFCINYWLRYNDVYVN